MKPAPTPTTPASIVLTTRLFAQRVMPKLKPEAYLGVAVPNIPLPIRAVAIVVVSAGVASGISIGTN
jgi:hypothetical protein